MTVQVVDSITLWNGSYGLLVTPPGFGPRVVRDDDFALRAAYKFVEHLRCPQSGGLAYNPGSHTRSND